MVKKQIKKEGASPNVFSALNLSVILMAAAFIIGTYSSLDSAAVRISNSCGFFCRLDNVMTGHIIVPVGSNYPTGNFPVLDAFLIIAILLVIAVAINFKKR